ncbi:hypothetical protein Ait01nite_091250 [Actinoplanes italicus]|nr:hypothetical protein Ait01nite_091250 [Actinoplanes italicus]
MDLDVQQCLVMLREKGNTFRRQPVSPTLTTFLLHHLHQRGALPDEQLLRYLTGGPVGPAPLRRAVRADRPDSAVGDRPGHVRALAAPHHPHLGRTHPRYPTARPGSILSTSTAWMP